MSAQQYILFRNIPIGLIRLILYIVITRGLLTTTAWKSLRLEKGPRRRWLNCIAGSGLNMGSQSPGTQGNKIPQLGQFTDTQVAYYSQFWIDVKAVSPSHLRGYSKTTNKRYASAGRSRNLPSPVAMVLWIVPYWWLLQTVSIEILFSCQNSLYILSVEQYPVNLLILL